LNSNIKIYCSENLEEVSISAFNFFAKNNQKSDNPFYIIPGGRTPKPLFNLLSKNISDWSNTWFILSDERIVNDVQQSNEYMVMREFISKINSDEKPNLIRYDKNGSLSKTERILESKSPGLTILGIGTDGHTASLFPGNLDIMNEKKICLEVKNIWESYNRISLSFGYLMKSNQIAFIATGESKAEVIKECLKGRYDPINYPSQYIFHNYKDPIHIFCDKAAGKYIV